jgi:pilus assembly protein CpaB
MRIFRNKLFVGCVCILLAVLIGFVVIPSLNKQQTGTTVVLQIKRDIHEGDSIDKSQLESVSIPLSVAPKNAVKSIDEATAKLAAHDLYVGDFLTTGGLATSQQMLDAFRKATAHDMHVISITLPSLASGLSGKLQPGDVVSVISIPNSNSLNRTLDNTNPESAPEQTETPPSAIIWDELRYVEVCGVTTAKGKTPDMSADTPELPTTVLLYVTDEQAERLVELEQTGRLHLMFVARGSDADKYLPDRVLK